VEAATELLTRLMVRFQLPPEYFAGLLGMGTIPWPRLSTLLAGASLFGVILLLAGGQSLAGFRRARLEEPVLVRYGSALALAAFISAGAATLIPRSAGMLLNSAPVRELRAAVRSVVVLPDDRGEAAERPIELGTLAETGLLSERTRAWLAGSHVRASGRRVSTIPARVFYDVRVRLASGREFRTTFLAPVKP
jgi:hypothetical protein